MLQSAVRGCTPSLLQSAVRGCTPSFRQPARRGGTPSFRQSAVKGGTPSFRQPAVRGGIVFSDHIKTPVLRRRILASYVPLCFYPSESASEKTIPPLTASLASPFDGVPPLPPYPLRHHHTNSRPRRILQHNIPYLHRKRHFHFL